MLVLEEKQMSGASWMRRSKKKDPLCQDLPLSLARKIQKLAGRGGQATTAPSTETGSA